MLNWKPEQQFRTNKNVIEVLNRCSKKMLKLSDVIGGGGGGGGGAGDEDMDSPRI